MMNEQNVTPKDVHQAIKAVVRALLANEPASLTEGPTAIANEIYMQLHLQELIDLAADDPRSAIRSNLGVRARHILIDLARRRRAAKRGKALRIELSDVEDDPTVLTGSADVTQLTDLQEALDELGAKEPRIVEVLELRFFAGLELKMIADVLGLSLATIKREVAAGCLLLRQRLEAGRD